MPLTQPRGMFAKLCKVDDVRVLYRYAIGPQCNMADMRAQIRVMSIPQSLAALYWNGPFAFLEYNLKTLFVPYTVASTFTPADHLESAPRLPKTDAEWDTLFRRIVFEFGTDGNEYYGGNPDGSGSTYDPTRNIFTRTRGANDSTENPSNDQEARVPSDQQDEPLINPDGISYGPRGIMLLDSQERILHSDSVSNIAKAQPSLLNRLLGTLGLNDIVFSDTLNLKVPVYRSGPGFVLMGCVRYAVGVAPGSAFTFSSTTTADKERLRALNALMTGDDIRIRNMLHFGTDDASNWLRSVLFAGDVDLDNFGTTALGQWYPEYTSGTNSSPLSKSDISLVGKIHMTLGIPWAQIPTS